MFDSKKRVAAALLCLVAGFAAGCGGGRERVNPDDKPVNANVSQLNVSNYEGGFGRKWLDGAAARFEEKYKDTEFEPGKKGVKINISSSINGTAGSSFVSGLASSTSDVCFTEDVFYYDLIAKGGAADITDIVTAELSEWGEEKSIADKLEPAIGSFFETSDQKYYALPHYEAYYGIIYDADLFRLRKLYFAKGRTPGEYGAFVQANNPAPPSGSFESYGYTDGADKTNLSAGPDGKYGTYDDGLPATYEEFFTLCDHMVSVGITPFNWAGSHPGMSSSALYQLWADYEGKDNFLKLFSLSGKADDLVESIAGNDVAGATLMPETEINENNAYLLHRQQGKYYAAEFARRIGRNVNYASDLSYSPSESHITSEGTYLLSRLESKKKPIAFHMNGVWWENEADESGYFDSYSVYGDTRMSRTFGLLPMPKVSEERIGDKRTIATNINLSLSFVNSRAAADPAKLALAKKFLQFVHTDEEMQNFSVATSTNKPLIYSIPAEKSVSMSPYGRSIAAMRDNPNIEMAYTFSNNARFIGNFAKFHPTEIDFKTDTFSRNVIKEFRDNPTRTVADFFDATVQTFDENWLR